VEGWHFSTRPGAALPHVGALQSREQLGILVGWENCSTSEDDQARLRIRPTGRRKIITSGMIFSYLHDNFLPTDNVSDGKADL